MFSTERQDLRQQYFDAWQKARNNEVLTPLEINISQVIADHPEYHSLFEQSADHYLDLDYQPEQGQTNPFLHLSLHMGIREQVATNRPKGIAQVYENLLNKLQNPLEVEHMMMEVLVDLIWQMQRDGHPGDEQLYLKKLKKLAKRFR